MVYYVVSGLLLMFFGCPFMAINVNVQYNGGFLPDIILWTQCYLHRGTCLNAMKRFCICSLLIPPKRFDIFSPITGGCSEGLGVFWFFFKHTYIHAGAPVATRFFCSFFLLFFIYLEMSLFPLFPSIFFRRFLFVWRVRHTTSFPPGRCFSTL